MAPNQQQDDVDAGPARAFELTDLDDAASASDIEARLQQLVAAVRQQAPPQTDEGSARSPHVPDLETEPPDAEPPWSFPIPTPTNGPRIGTALIERGLITQADLDQALQSQLRSRKRLGEILVEMGAVSSLDLSRALADHLGIPFVDLDQRPPDVMLSGLVPEEVARRYRVIPVERWSGQVVVAMSNPNDVFALDDLRVLTGQPVIAAMADPEQLNLAIERNYQRSDLESTLDDAVDDYTSDDDALGKLTAAVEDGPVVKLVNALLEQALAEHASDLHIEPASRIVKIRLRIDGMLHDTSEAPLSVLRPLVSRLKVMAGLDIAQSRAAQDGRFSLNLHGRAVDVRVASVPTAAGEAVVLRLLDPQRGITNIQALGLSERERERFLPAFQAPQGAVFVTGPTGSGKSSTLYALLSQINSRDKSVVSVEDPVEFRVDGVKQIQVNVRAGTTFPNALRSILRADPDVILIGEVRDAETARIAADASITGHLVLSTLHATRAAAAPIRLVDMGIEPYLIASALSCIAAQRLARRLCTQCAKDVEHPDVNLLRRFGATDEILGDELKVRAAVGCSSCRGTGYRGRAAIFEIMPVTEDISRLIVERAASAEIERVAVAQGMDTLRVAALRKVVRGDLGIDEMLRVVT